MKAKQYLLTLFVMFGLIMITSPVTSAQTCDGSGNNFVDLDGDGFNDNAPDADGDGIPNGLDPDYIKQAKDGTGYMHKKGQASTTANSGEVQPMTQSKIMTKYQTANKFMTANSYKFQKRINQSADAMGQMSGVCDGTGPIDGTGSGTCDGDGPHGPKGNK